MNWILRIFARRRLYRDLSEEIEQHLEERIDALIEGGTPRSEAIHIARREFGNATLIAEQSREVWQWPIFDSLLFDLRYAVRQLIRQPSFAVIAVLILGIGIGANTVVFSIVDRLLFESLPLRSPDRLVWVINSDTPGLSGRTSQVSTYEALEKMASFEETTTYEAFFARSSYKLAGDQLEPDRVSGVMVSANFFPFLGVKPFLGRAFTEEECLKDGPGAVMLNYDLWVRRYSADPKIVGRQMRVNDRAATIVGVLPASFDFGQIFAPGNHMEVFLPVIFDTLRDWGNTMAILGRLKPGVSLESAQDEATGVIERLQQERPEFGPPGSYHAILKPFQQSVTGTLHRPMMLLWGAVLLVQLIVCVNLSTLLLARATARRKEMALRGALGAGRFRLARQWLTETSVLSLSGGALGVGLAWLAVWGVRQSQAVGIPLLRTVDIDGTVLGLAAGVTILTALALCIAPVVAVARGNLNDSLKEGGRGAHQEFDHSFARTVLVVSEICLACLLVVGAGLLILSFLKVLDVDLGFTTQRTYALRVDPGPAIDTQEKFENYMRQLIAAAREVPGVAAASVSDALPFDSNRSWVVRAREQRPEDVIAALVKVVGPGLMETMQTPILSGREFTNHDDGRGRPVALINETLAHRIWPDEDAVGQFLQVFDTAREVVGVVADVHHLSVEEPSGPEFYIPVLQARSMSPSLVVRTDRSFSDVVPALRRELAAVAPDLPTNRFRPLSRLVDRQVSPRLFFVRLLGGFALVALLLAAIGIYGVVSYSVQRRTPEIGIRMALGASGGRILKGVVGETMKLALVGVVLGLVGAVALSSLLASLMFAVSPTDPWALLAAALVVLAAAALAGFLPALRAARVSPIHALHNG
ncbi:MAG: ABC transporter permease [Acidobacteriota bacterium]